MPFQPGQSGNPLGKPAGVKNKISDSIRHFWAMLLQENMDEASMAFKELLKEDRQAALSLMLKASNKFVGDAQKTNEEGEAVVDKLLIQFINDSHD